MCDEAGMANPELSFLEIEHKFLLKPGFDAIAFRDGVIGLCPIKTYSTTVSETYVLTQKTPELVYRHRYDTEQQDITYKPSNPKDPQIRKEVRLVLDPKCGNQKNQFLEFLSSLHITWEGGLTKELTVYMFHDCEIVFYTAKSNSKVVSCIEFEALSPNTIEEAIQAIEKYENKLGFISAQRCLKSLFQLLFEDIAPGR